MSVTLRQRPTRREYTVFDTRMCLVRTMNETIVLRTCCGSFSVNVESNFEKMLYDSKGRLTRSRYILSPMEDGIAALIGIF